MIAPIEIENKEFKKGIVGYKEEEVDEFLDLVKEDYEQLYRENADLKEKVRLYQDQINNYESIEKNLNAALVRAEEIKEDISNAANKQAKIIVEDAKLQAKQIIDQANNEV
ncbi:MAG: DivIVA domain-containing protein, partial [Romboutsia sp.]|nr:DivIVA domain-containing protein [Romboutsia sp.]